MGECNTFTRVIVRSRNDPSKIIEGYIVWRTEDSFGLDVERNGFYQTLNLTYKQWKIIYYY